MTFGRKKKRREREAAAEANATGLLEAAAPAPIRPQAPVRPAELDDRDDLGQLEALLANPLLSAILVNGPRDVYVERSGSLERADLEFASEGELLSIIRAAARRAGSVVDAENPMLDGRFPDGTVVNAIVPPLAIDGPVLSIRRADAPVSLEQLIATRTMNRVVGSFLTACVRARCTILVAGTSGSGKSTLLQTLMSVIPTHERVATLEQVAELRKGNRPAMVRIEVPGGPGDEASTQRAIIAQAKRMHADRIVLGDIRQTQAAPLVDALLEDTEGALASIHAASPQDALDRLVDLLDGAPRSAATARRSVARAIDVVVQVSQMLDRSRRVTSIAQPMLAPDGALIAREIFAFEQTADGSGRWLATGFTPTFLDRIRRAGVDVPVRIFDAAPKPPDDDTSDELRAQLARQDAELAALKVEVEKLRKPREARLGALLGLVDVADAIRRVPVTDDRMRMGIDALHARLDAMLAGIGFENVAAPGMAVDEAAHEVIGEVDRSDVPPQTIAAVKTRGFRAQGELLRRAKVLVGKQQPTV